MKLIAIGLNTLLILTLLWLLSTKGMGKDDAVLFVVFIAAPISSLLTLTLNGGEGWLGLYFKRKTLEEKQKIEKLGG